MPAPSIAQRRLVAQHVARPALASPRAVVAHMGAVQAQDLAASLWAIGLRLRRPSLAAVERAVARAEILRTWPMRRTIHFVPAKDARGMVRLLATRQRKASARRLRELGVGERAIGKARTTLARALARGPLPRGEAYRALERAGVATGGQRGIHLVNHLAHEGLLCLGPPEGKQATVALIEQLTPDRVATPSLDELAARYAASHGPVSVADLAWWAGVGKREAAEALGGAKGVREEDGLWSASRPRRVRAPSPDAHLLPAFDESAVAYKDRSAALERVGARANAQIGLLSPCVVVDGQMVGTWGRTLGKDEVRIALKPLLAWSRDEREAIERAAERYARFLGLGAAVEVRARSGALPKRRTAASA